MRYALDDEVDLRVARTSIAAQIRIHAAAGADEIVPFAAVGARWRRGEDLEAFIAACSASRCGPAASGCSPPTR